MATESKRDLVLGTAGHIDHGKSTLVQALTGTDPDRLSEEKQRGITIELGFAQLELPDGSAMGVVDVPGHERFVRQMIAGSTGIDVALLCIAADDGIMPQTEEHLAVLQLLAVPTCVVALTKCDLVDEEWALFMEDEVRTRLASTPYAQAAIVPVSARTGQGLKELRDAIQLAARATAGRAGQEAMRLPVDRSFTIKGAGTVVTGTLWSGIAHVGDEVEVLPSGLRTRIRGIQVHGQAVEQAAFRTPHRAEPERRDHRRRAARQLHLHSQRRHAHRPLRCRHHLPGHPRSGQAAGNRMPRPRCERYHGMHRPRAAHGWREEHFPWSNGCSADSNRKRYTGCLR